MRHDHPQAPTYHHVGCAPILLLDSIMTSTHVKPARSVIIGIKPQCKGEQRWPSG